MITTYLPDKIISFQIIPIFIFFALACKAYGSPQEMEEINHQLEKKIYSYKDNIKLIMKIVKELRNERKVFRDNNEDLNEKLEKNRNTIALDNIKISNLVQKGARIVQTYGKGNLFHRQRNLSLIRELQLNFLRVKLLDNRYEELFNNNENYLNNISENNDSIQILSKDIDTLESLLLLYRKKLKHIVKIYRTEDHKRSLESMSGAFQSSIYQLTKIFLEDLNRPLEVVIPSKELHLLELESEQIFNNYYMLIHTQLHEKQKKLEARLEILDAENIRKQFIVEILDAYRDTNESQRMISFFENLAKAIFSLKLAATVISSEEVGCEDSKLDIYRSLSLMILEGIPGLVDIPYLKSAIYGISAKGVAYIRSKQLQDNKTLYFDRDSMLFSTQLSYLAAREIIGYLDLDKIFRQKKLNSLELIEELAGYWEKSLLSKHLSENLPILEFSSSSVEENQLSCLISEYHKNYTEEVGKVFYSKVRAKKYFRKLHRYLK